MYSRKHYLELLEDAGKQLCGSDIEARAAACGFQVRENPVSGKEIIIDYFNRRFRSAIIDIVPADDGGRPMPLQIRIIALHYLISAGTHPVTGEFIPLKKIPGLENYGGVIKRRSEDVLVRAFGDKPALLKETVVRLGGAPVDIGDAAGRLFPLPRIPILAVFSSAEENIPAYATLMFDRSATSLLPLEDLVVLAEIVSHKLSNVSETIRKSAII
jgi:hypothetical protein